MEQLTLLLGLLLRRLGSGFTTGSGSAARSGGSSRTASGADVQQQVLDVLALERLGEELAPDGLDLGNLGGSDEGLEFVGL